MTTTGASPLHARSDVLRDVTLRDGLQLTGKLLPTDARSRPSATCWPRRARHRDRLDGPARPGPADGQHPRCDRGADPRGTGQVLGLGGHPAHVEQGGRRPVHGTSSTACPRRTRTTRPTSAAPPRTASPPCPRRSTHARAVDGADPAVHRHRLHLPVRRAIDPERASSRSPSDPRADGTDRHRRLRHPRPGHPRPGRRPDAAYVSASGAGDRLPRPRHLGPRRRQHPRRDRGRRRHGRRRPRRARRLPFAPGASGNTSTEDLLFALRPDWLTPDGFRRLVRALRRRCSPTSTNRTGPEPAQGASERTAFPWAFPDRGSGHDG